MGLLVLLGLLRLVFPGDVPFIADEPLIMERVLDDLESGTVASVGLQGTRGVAYGPVPAAFYGSVLAVTSDLRLVAVAKIVTVTLLSGWALLLLGRVLPAVSLPLAAFAFLSPYLWFYARDLWDNSFAIPFSAMLLASYAHFHASDRMRWLASAGLFAVLCASTHFMTLPLVMAVAIHFLLLHGRRLLTSRAFALRVSAIGAACALVMLPYLSQLSPASAGSLLWSPSPRALLFALDGFRTFTLVGFDYVIGPWQAGGTGLPLRLLSAFTYVVGAWGVVLLNRQLRAGGVWRAAGGSPEGGGPEAPRDAASAVAGVVALTLVLFVIVANGKRLVEHPHYYSGVWIAFFLLWWMGMSDLLRRAWARRIFYVQSGAMAVFLVALVVWIHQNRGTRSLHYGPTLGNQMAVARELDRQGVEDAPPSTAPHPRVFPQAIRTLRRLNAREGGVVAPAATTPTGFSIGFSHPDGASGEIVVQPPAGG